MAESQGAAMKSEANNDVILFVQRCAGENASLEQ